jgi:hypothetical protein
MTLPVGTAQVGWVNVPTVGAVGDAGTALITTFADAGDVQPAALVTVKLYVPVARPVIVVLVPVPETDPGLIVQLPAGRPVNITLPVGTAQVGWVMVPAVGAAGVAGWAAITTLADGDEAHPAAFITVKLYVPATRPEIVVVIPVPAIAPGLIVQLPAGKLLRTTLPVATAQVGWVIVPAVGVAGAPGAAVITTFADAGDVQPEAFVTVKLYVAAGSPVTV